tara:strand:+ start:15330 stop:16142 length:813 start_codon:yes stop_codon:yes gene_type:complete
MKFLNFTSLISAVAVSACATYPGPAESPTDQAKFAAIELKSSMEQAYIIDSFENEERLQNTRPSPSALDAAALATDLPVSFVFMALAVANSDGSQDVVSKYVLPETINGKSVASLNDVNEYVSGSVIETAQHHGFSLFDMSEDKKLLLLRTADSKPMYLRIYNFGAKAVEHAPSYLSYAWGFTPAWEARKPASFNVCWGEELPFNDDGSYETGAASDGRQIPLVNCDRTIPGNVASFLQELSGTGYFVYANKSVRVNRLYFKGNGYNPYW